MAIAEKMTQCVIFDLGGVVFESPIVKLAELESSHGLEVHALNRFIMQSSSWSALEKGIMNPVQFTVAYDAEVSEMARRRLVDDKLLSITGETVLRTIASAGAESRPAYREAIAALRSKGFKTVALTNNFQSLGATSALSLVSGMFDLVVESSMVGLRKPDPAIYRLVCEKAHVTPAHCVFLDDIGKNLVPAKEMGMDTIRVSGQDVGGVDALHKLEKILGQQLFETDRRVMLTAKL